MKYKNIPVNIELHRSVKQYALDNNTTIIDTIEEMIKERISQ